MHCHVGHRSPSSNPFETAIRRWLLVAGLSLAGTQAGIAAINPPTGVQTAPGLSGNLPKVTVTWTPPASGTTPAAYRIRRHTALTGGTFTELVPDIPAPTTTGTDLGGTGSGSPPLAFNTEYWYNVASITAGGGNSTFSQPRIVVRTVPAAPTALVATPSSQPRVTLGWTAPPPGTGPAPTSYNIKRSLNAGGPFTDAEIVGTSATTSFLDNSVAFNTQYYYVVSAVGSGQGPNSAVATATTPPAPPGIPTGLTVTMSQFGAPVLNWTAPVGGGAPAGYKVFRATTNGSIAHVFVGSVSAVTSWTDEAAPNETVLYYLVSAFNAGGESAKSIEAHAMSRYKRTPKLLISEISANPSGTPDSPKEFVELVATDSIDFSLTPYCVVFSRHESGSGAGEDGWIEGCARTYGFNITSGTVLRGGTVYVGGSSMQIGGVTVGSGNQFRVLDPSTTDGDRFGTMGNDIVGNGGSHADGVAVFATDIWNLKSGTVPVDALFWGDARGNAVFGPNGGYQLPVNDLYSGGKFQDTSPFVSISPNGDQIIAVQTAPTVSFNLDQDAFTSPRVWVAGTHTDNSANFGITSAVGAPSFRGIPERFSGAVSDTTSPLTFTVTPTPSALPTAASGNPAVVPSANITVTQIIPGQYSLSIAPVAAGYANITISATAGGVPSTIRLQYAASAAGAASTRYHTFASDASAAIALDANYMLVADDEDQVIRVYGRQNSGQPLRVFDFTSALGLTARKNCANNLKEVDIEASSTMLIGSPPNQTKRFFWIGALGNEDDGGQTESRNRVFATDLTGSGLSSWNLQYVGRYDSLRQQLIAWDATSRVACNGAVLGAGHYGLAASAAAGKLPKQIDGFNIEGLAIVGSTAYIGFRAPYSPPVGMPLNRHNTLIVPLNNINQLVTVPGTAPIWGPAIELDLHGRGIRSMEANASGDFVIVAGAYDNTDNFRLFTWDGICGSQPAERAINLSGLTPEAIVEAPSSPITDASTIQLLSDNGRTIWNNDNIQGKSLADPFTKSRSDVITIGPKVNGVFSSVAAPLNVGRGYHTATLLNDGRVLVVGGYSETQGYLLSAELFNPLDGTWSMAAPMYGLGRYNHTATRLSDGKVLVAGGRYSTGTPASDVQVYDPSTDMWSSTISLATARYGHGATLLGNGLVVVEGGIGVSGGEGVFLASAEINVFNELEPEEDIWTPIAPMNVARRYHSATLLQDGKILVAGGDNEIGGILSSAELYDPVGFAWTPTGAMTTWRSGHTATLLPSGRVLATGWGTADVYNPATETWAAIGTVDPKQGWHTATLLPNGTVLVTGGVDSGGPSQDTQIYNPATGTWTTSGPLNGPRNRHTATLLPNGKVLIIGGFSDELFSTLGSAEMYTP